MEAQRIGVLPNLGIQENFLEVVTPKRTGSKVEGAFQAEKTAEANSQRTGLCSMWGNYRQSRRWADHRNGAVGSLREDEGVG